MKRTIAGGLTLAMLLALQGAALADDSARGHSEERDAAQVQETDVVKGDRVTDRAKTVTDRPSDKVKEHVTDVRRDLRRDVVKDRPSDRPATDRCHLVTNDHVRRICKQDKPSDVNIRHLIHRLVHAGEWAKLIRLLHRLGWI
jgi:hypothetical protein